MRKLIIVILSFLFSALLPAKADALSFVGEKEMMQDILGMLGRFTQYLSENYEDSVATSKETGVMGCFRSGSFMQANEDGVRTNADLSMVAAFLCRYGEGATTLPKGIDWKQLRVMARRSLGFAIATHKANRWTACKNGKFWGSVSKRDHTWESSLWATSVAFSAFFQWDSLTNRERNGVRRLLEAECQYELERTVPTNYIGDTKAEENGWEADVLAATLGLFPDHPKARAWFDRLRLFAINSYSHPSDSTDTTVIDPHYDNATVADLYIGSNLYNDFTLQNHNYFHTSYQNVVIQELGEAALALRLFQQQLHGRVVWRTRALMHHNLDVQRKVLNWLALADGELAMPNGNDWSLFLYDQITSYSTNATFLRDSDALMLENRAYQMIKRRQQTTPDGSWLLRPDIGQRRMGVEAHRLMMTWLMHYVNSTERLKPSSFESFRQQHSAARVSTEQNIVRAYTADRFTTFGWQKGIGSFTGYIALRNDRENNLTVPYKNHNTGNFIGWYDVEGHRTNAKPIVSGNYQTQGDAWVMNGEIATNDSALDNRFVVYSSPGNAVVYMDNVTANDSCTVVRERGGLTAVSVDPLTHERRSLITANETTVSDGRGMTHFNTPWLNIDQTFGVVTGKEGRMAFGDRVNNNSVLTAMLYPLSDDRRLTVRKGESVGKRWVAYYSNVDARSTQGLSRAATDLTPSLPEGWGGVIVADPDSVRYWVVSNFRGALRARVAVPLTSLGYAVLSQAPVSGSIDLDVPENSSHVEVVRFFIDNLKAEARLTKDDRTLLLTSKGHRRTTATLRVATPKGIVTKRLKWKGRMTVTLGNDGTVSCKEE